MRSAEPIPVDPEPWFASAASCELSLRTKLLAATVLVIRASECERCRPVLFLVVVVRPDPSASGKMAGTAARSAGYVDGAVPLVRAQIAKASVRLAEAINRAAGASMVERGENRHADGPSNL